MASGWYTEGLAAIADGRIDLDTSTLKLMLVDAGYTFNADHDVVDPGTNDAADLSHNEITATGYTAGWGGAGRKTASITMQKNDAQNRLEIAIADPAWTGLGGAVNDTVAAVVLIKEGGANDTTSIPVAHLDFADLTTNGGNLTLDMATLGAGGNLQIAV